MSGKIPKKNISKQRKFKLTKNNEAKSYPPITAKTLSLVAVGFSLIMYALIWPHTLLSAPLEWTGVLVLFAGLSPIVRLHNTFGFLAVIFMAGMIGDVFYMSNLDLLGSIGINIPVFLAGGVGIVGNVATKGPRAAISAIAGR
ncbi:MAG: hypothetical protein ABIH76_07995 [Candidatus Bathyarchaeota archaeon]